MQHVLVTGAGGYIGSVLVPMLLAQGVRVRAVDRLFFGRDRLPVDADRLDVIREDVRRLTAEHLADIDAVIDLVAVSNDASGEEFAQATWEINADARVRTAKLAREAGVRRYILPSSCSIYGATDIDVAATEQSKTNPLTTYARANERAERETLALAGDDFDIVVLRQATVFGISPRMRFDLAINGMTYGAWRDGRLPLMRDGSQWRPMLHVRDAARALIFMLNADSADVNRRIFNVGSASNTFQIGSLGERIAALVPRHVEVCWYGDPDRRTYRVDFSRIEALGFKATESVEAGVQEICAALEAGKVDRTADTITLDWYRALRDWHRIVRETEMYGGMLEL